MIKLTTLKHYTNRITINHILKSNVRLFVTTRDHDTRDFIDTVPDQILIVITLVIIITFLIIIIITLKSLLIPSTHKPLFSKLLTNSYVLSWLRIKDFITNAPYKLYEIIFNTINLRHFVVVTATPLKVYYNYPKITYILFFILPRVVVSTIFIIDLCYNQQFTYFYNSLVLLLIPVITYSYLYAIGHLTHVNITFIDKHLDIVRSHGEITVSVKTVQPTFEDAMDITDIDLDNLMKHRLIFRTLRDYASEILLLKKRKEPYILLYTSFCYLIGWSYYLWFITNPSIETFSVILSIQDTLEPFSGLELNTLIKRH
jgi:hypothetical protein